MLTDVASGLEILLHWEVLAYLLAGLLAGFLVGVLPGFSGANAAAIVLPFSIGLPVETSLMLIVGIYAGASFAGAVPAILLNIPGTAGAAATAIDGYPMAQQGRAGEAISVARTASAIGGVLGALLVLAVIQPLSRIALSFGSREMFIVGMLCLLIIGAVIGTSVLKGLAAALLGFLVSTMSSNPMTAVPRLTFNMPELLDGMPLIPAIIGLFAFTEMFFLAGRQIRSGPDGAARERTGMRPALTRAAREVAWGWKACLSYPGTLVRSAGIGTVLGVVPGLGGAVTNFISYGIAKRRSPNGARFGQGEPEGIVASEAADNAMTNGTLVPTLTLGIPGSGVAAVVLASLYLHGIQPGPRVMVSHTGEVYAVLLGLLLASMLILPIGLVLATPLTYVIRIPSNILVPVIFVLSTVGAFAVRNSVIDVWIALAFGLLGVALRLVGIPVVPLVLGLIIGPIVESNLLRALRLGNNQLEYFFQSPVALVLWALFLAMLLHVGVRIFRRPSPDKGKAAVR